MKPDGFAVEGSDCNDLLPDVFPKQSAFFPSGYAVGAGVSFDYDCSRTEEPDTSQLGAAVPQCPGLLANCGAALPGFKSTGRSGPGVKACAAARS